MTEWQPIETAPKDGTTILLVRFYGAQVCGETDHWTVDVYGDDRPRDWCDTGGRPPEYAWTHWLPLPPPPKAP